MDLSPRDILAYEKTVCQRNWTGVEPLLHFHNHDAGFPVAGHDRALNGRRAAPARKQGRMHVQAAERRRIQDGFRQDQAIGGDHGNIGRQASELLLDLRPPQGFGREHRDRRFVGEHMNGGLSVLHAAPGGPRRLRVYAHDIVPSAYDFAQRWDGKVGRAHEDNA